MTVARDLAGLSVLIVDDEADLRLALRRLLEPTGAQIAEADDGEVALRRMAERPADVVLTDLTMPRMGGVELLPRLKARWPEAAVIVLTGYGTIQSAVTCMQAGAATFLTKPCDNHEILDVVVRLGRHRLAARAPAEGERELTGADPRMRATLDLIERVAPSPVSVLIEGESGVGKELVARRIHAQSLVAGKGFHAVNAAALPDTLLEAELFGYRRGAFTGADRDKDGLFVTAGGGTVFLDEVASMSLAFQGKLLRVLQEKVVRPLGATADIAVEFRLLAATNRDLAAMIREGTFREDLYYRLRVVSIPVPPLRERAEDVLPLARRFLVEAAVACLRRGAVAPRFSDEATAALRAHRWPGNVRELLNAVQRAVIVCAGETIEPHHLGLGLGAGSGSARGRMPSIADADYESSKREVIERFQREFVQRALERTGGNVSVAAERCGMTRAALQRIMRSLAIERAEFLPAKPGAEPA
ncbi:MAG: sigma-54-dependent Fis family transcriptional regulator [Planctomycetes bacterium]|nr:sigma-54-dependent Fis family transcriptional regulator [Planctomycetota bacterium]